MSGNDDKDEISKALLYTIMILMMLFGTANTIVMKYQDDFVVGENPDGSERVFTHPYFQCANMFLGELCCLFVFFGKRMYLRVKGQREQEELDPQSQQAVPPASPGTQIAEQVQLKRNINPFWFAIPALFDCTASSLMFVALTQCAASVYQMMRGAIVIITAIFSVLFLKRSQYAHHLIALVIIVAGVALVGWASLAYSKDDDSKGSSTTLLGILLLLLSQCFTASQFVIEEKLFDGYYLDPLFCVGCEGFFGVCYFVILLPIFQRVPCTVDGVCGDNGVIEDTTLAFNQLGEHYELLLMSLGIIVSISAFNATGQAITKHASAAQRSTIDTCRTLFVWLIQLATKNEVFNVPQLLAFFLLVFGTLVYNEILIIPIDFMRRNTKVERDKRDKGRLDENEVAFLDEQRNNYIATSPGAGYDHGRNVRAIEKKLHERDELLQNHQKGMMLGTDDNDEFITKEGPPPKKFYPD